MIALYEKIKGEIEDGHLQEAMLLTEKGLEVHPDEAYLYYLKGKIFMKQGNWQMATNCFLKSEELDENSPAVEARKMLADIMNFYHKDLYNP